MNKKLGQISIPLAFVITGGFTLVGSVVTGVSSYYSALRATDNEIAQSRSDIAVLQSQKNDIVASQTEIKDGLNRLSDKVDALLINRGIDPDNIKTVN